MVEGEVDRAEDAGDVRARIKSPPKYAAGNASGAEDAGDVRARIKAKLSPGARAAYERMSAMSDEEYLEMSHRRSDERMLKEMLERIP